MASPTGRSEELQGRVRGLLIAVSSQLPATTVEIVDEMIGANEHAVGLEIIGEMLIESEAAITEETLAEFARLSAEIGLDQSLVDQLRSRVQTK